MRCSLLDPAYSEIGPNTCVGMTGGWAEYSWPPAIALTSCMVVFLMDFAAERYVEKKYGLAHGVSAEQTDAAAGMQRNGSIDAAALRYSMSHRPSQLAAAPHHGHQHLHSGEQDRPTPSPANAESTNSKDLEMGNGSTEVGSIDSEKERAVTTAFQQQIAAFLILEFGVIFHSVIIGLTLGTAGAEFSVLYPVTLRSSRTKLAIHADTIKPGHRLPPILRRSRYRCPLVGHPIPEKTELDAMVALRRLWSDYTHRNCCGFRRSHNIQCWQLHGEHCLWRPGRDVCWHFAIHGSGRTVGKRLLVQS